MNDRLKIVNSYSDAKMLLDFGELRRNGRDVDNNVAADYERSRIYDVINGIACEIYTM